MKNVIAMILAVLVCTSCASMQTRWSKVSLGQTKEEVFDIMGQPDQIQTTEDGKYAYGWNFNAFSGCGVILDHSSKVSRQFCGEDAEARDRYQAAVMMMMQKNRSSFTPMSVYQTPRPIQTNCKTTLVGGIAQSDCSSAPGGIDTSIYH